MISPKFSTYNFSLPLIIILLMTSCGSGTKKNVQIIEKINIEIDPRNFSDNKFFLSDIADDIIYIPLDNSILIGPDHSSFRVINQKIYVGGEHSLVSFDMEGKNPKQIGNKGKGPGEYLYCNYFTVDDTGNIYVLGRRDIIFVYSPGGKFLKGLKLPDGSFFQDIDFLGSSLFLAEHIHGGHSPYKWLIIDTSGIVLSQKQNFKPPSTSGQGPSGGIYKYQNEISYWDNKIDTVYTIKTDFTYEPSLVVPPGNHRLPFEGIPFNISPREYIEKIQEFFLFGNLIETNNYYLLNYGYERENNTALINKENGKISRGMAASFYIADAHKWGIPNGIDNGLNFQVKGYFTEEGKEYLFSVIQPFQLKLHVQSESFKNSTPKYPGKKKQLEELSGSLDENDNPVLVIVKLNE